MLDIACTALVPGETVHAPVSVRAGGSPVTAALWAKAEGLAATVVGRVGADVAGQAVRGTLAAAGVEARLAADPDLPTGAFLLACVGGERDAFAGALLAGLVLGRGLAAALEHACAAGAAAAAGISAGASSPRG